MSQTTQQLLKSISWQLQNPRDEADRLAAFGALQQYRLTQPVNQEAEDLYTKYSRLSMDWTQEVKSGK